MRETAQLWLSDGSSVGEFEDALGKRLQAADLRHHHIGRNLEGSVGGGDYTLDLLWADAPTADLLTGLGGLLRDDRLAYAPLVTGCRQADMTNGIRRTLLLRVHPNAEHSSVARFEQEVAAMPDYMEGIRNWSLGRVISPSRWTHVWQQEYQQVEDLLGEYLMHPYHWGYIDRFFDLDSPDCIVDQHLAHCFSPLASSAHTLYANNCKGRQE
ncbi:MAG: Dabb family protein [Caldilineaceae bacterium]|nr:Dabb family protein [Caldilineaceae bacterium]MCB1666376.1 Dabb family protein [Pseudomonadales bacterium]